MGKNKHFCTNRKWLLNLTFWLTTLRKRKEEGEGERKEQTFSVKNNSPADFRVVFALSILQRYVCFCFIICMREFVPVHMLICGYASVSVCSPLCVEIRGHHRVPSSTASPLYQHLYWTWCSESTTATGQRSPGSFLSTYPALGELRSSCLYASSLLTL